LFNNFLKFITIPDKYDLSYFKLILRDPKSGREYEYVYIPAKIAESLREYAKSVCNKPDDRVFPISYEAARMNLLKAGKLAGIHFK